MDEYLLQNRVSKKNITMKKTTFFLMLLFVVFHLSAQYVLEPGYIEMKKSQESMTSITFKSLKLIPLFAGNEFITAHQNLNSYVPLSEAIEKKWVIITETGGAQSNQENDSQITIINDSLTQQSQTNSNQIQNQSYISNQYNSSGTVNQLMIKNLTNDTILIMAGELIVGGKQDRIIAENLLIPPGSGFIPIPVFCVEQGRWAASETGSNFSQYNAFTANSIRKQAVQNESQTDVWNQVSIVTSKNNAESSTSTFNSVFNNEEFMKQFNEYIEFFTTEFAKLDNCIGFVGISGDKIIGCDLFAKTEIFQSQTKNLLSAYITEAITIGGTPSVSDNDVQAYLRSFLTGGVDQEDRIDEKGKSFQHGDYKLHIATF